ncbi:MAG: DUF2202 domain-containing protein [Thermodesulfobacteriota bacterium]
MFTEQKSRLFFCLAIVVVVLLLAGCGSDDDNDKDSGPDTVVGSGTESEPASDQVDSSLGNYLTAAINDEYKARNTYQAVIDTHGEVRPFVNIKRSEEQHIQMLVNLFNNYSIPVPGDNTGRPSSPSTVQAACQVGVQAEIDNASLYDRLLSGTKDYPDVQAVFKQLQAASLDKHLPAFQRCAG